MMQELHDAFSARNTKKNKIELIKELKSPMSVYDGLKELCQTPYEDVAPEDKNFFLKCFGLFDKGEGEFMIRMRIPGGQLTQAQAKVVGTISKEFGNDYIDITTRQQIELRFIKFANLHHVITELDNVGITTFQTGVDNFRNIVTSPLDGVATDTLIETMPLIEELQSIFLRKEEWNAVLPRKFNTAILGRETNDCNIFGHDCCFVPAKKGDTLGFNLYLGGKVGVQAEDSGLFVKPQEVKEVFFSVINLFKEFGFRDNRNKNRLHFLIEAVGMEAFSRTIQQTTRAKLQSSGELMLKYEQTLGSDGTTALKDERVALHYTIPSGVFSGSDLLAVAKTLEDKQASIRLSVEQSFYVLCSPQDIVPLKESAIYKKYAKFNNPYFVNQIACAGTATCSFGVIPNKPDAIEMAEYLAQEVPLQDAKVRMYWSACVKGCGLHGVADIGFEGCKAKDEEGNSCYGVHILLGGKASHSAKEARVIYKSVPLHLAKYTVKKIMLMYKSERHEKESFESFDSRVLAALETEALIEKIESYVTP